MLQFNISIVNFIYKYILPIAGVAYKAKCRSVHYRVHNSLSNDTTLVHINPLNNSITSFLNIRLDSILPSKPRYLTPLILKMFFNYNSAFIYLHML